MNRVVISRTAKTLAEAKRLQLHMEALGLVVRIEARGDWIEHQSGDWVFARGLPVDAIGRAHVHCEIDGVRSCMRLPRDLEFEKRWREDHPDSEPVLIVRGGEPQGSR